MGKLLLAVAVAIASFIVAESLVCNSCSFGLLGYCLDAADETCQNDNSTCFTSTAKFPSLASFSGFNMQGCAPNDTDCGTITNFTLLTVNYTKSYTCCNTEKCNTVVLSAAPSSKMALSVAIGASILAFMFSM